MCSFQVTDLYGDPVTGLQATVVFMVDDKYRLFPSFIPAEAMDTFVAPCVPHFPILGGYSGHAMVSHQVQLYTINSAPVSDGNGLVDYSSTNLTMTFGHPGNVRLLSIAQQRSELVRDGEAHCVWWLVQYTLAISVGGQVGAPMKRFECPNTVATLDTSAVVCSPTGVACPAVNGTACGGHGSCECGYVVTHVCMLQACT